MSKRLERFKEAGFLGCLNGVQSGNMEWISVEDLEPIKKDMLCFSSCGKIHIARWSHTFERHIIMEFRNYNDTNAERSPLEFTHWMPLPEGPKE